MLPKMAPIPCPHRFLKNRDDVVLRFFTLALLCRRPAPNVLRPFPCGCFSLNLPSRSELGISETFILFTLMRRFWARLQTKWLI